MLFAMEGQSLSALAVRFIGKALVFVIVCAVAWFILNLIANWKLLFKAGKGGWQSLVPVWNHIARYGICWSKWVGLAVCVVAPIFVSCCSESESTVLIILVALVSIAAFVCSIIEKVKLAKVFGKSSGFAIGLIFLEPLFIMILAFGDAQYVGKE